jgi:hypothetical protein
MPGCSSPPPRKGPQCIPSSAARDFFFFTIIISHISGSMVELTTETLVFFVGLLKTCKLKPSMMSCAPATCTRACSAHYTFDTTYVGPLFIHIIHQTPGQGCEILTDIVEMRIIDLEVVNVREGPLGCETEGCAPVRCTWPILFVKKRCSV